ncbi:hypothetical protein [Marinobacter sp.]|uniref:hypothetical protein n=1 Tax=Marinobacter sp. TaxID=50741 RepID=UPI001B623DE4|nr:hypothetical protein [Marinobacter sp.]MBQ0834780.1 hypothetical protein [Marinobacter sp.]
MAHDSYRYCNAGNLSKEGIQTFGVTSKHVELPEGVILENTAGLLFERSILGDLCPEVAWAVAGDLVATVFPERHCVSLFRKKCWQELREILENMPRGTLEQRALKRVALGFETCIRSSEPLIVTGSLECYARLTGDDVLVVKNSDYMELWAKDRLPA